MYFECLIQDEKKNVFVLSGVFADYELGFRE